MAKIDVNALLNLIDTDPWYRAYTQRLRRAKIMQKPWFWPRPHLSVAFGNFIFYSRELHVKEKFMQAGMLLHECQHLFQVDRRGMLSSAIKYLQKSGRAEVEKAAYAINLRWYVTAKKITNPASSTNPINHIKTNGYVRGIVVSLMTHYHLEGYFTEDELWQWALEEIQKLF